MKYFLLFSLCLLYPSVRAISQVVQNSPENRIYHDDTALFNRYMEKAIHFSDMQPDSSHYFSSKAYNLAKSVSYSKGLAKYYHFLAAEYNEHGHYDSAMQVAEKELYWANRSKNHSTIGWAYNALANTYEYTGNMDSAMIYFIKALNVVEPEQNKDKKLTGTLNYNLASVLFLIGDYQRALPYARKGLSIGKAMRDTHMMSSSLLDIGSIQVGLKHYDTALSIFDHIIGLIKHTADSSTIMDALNDEGDVYAKKGEYHLSLEKYVQMLQLAKRYNDPSELLYAYGNLGITQFQINKLDDAEENLKEAIQIGLRLHARDEVRQFSKSLSEVEEAKHQYASSLRYRKIYDSLNNVLMNESAKKNIHSLEIKYQTVQKDKQIAQQKLVLSQKQHAIQRKNTWILIFLGSLVALIAILILSIRSYRHKRKLHEQSLLTLQKEHEVNTLKAKMEAREEERNRIGKEMHDDVGSALTTILYLSNDLNTALDNKNTAAKIAGTAGMVVDKMNEIIWSMNREYDTLDDLIAYTRQHVAQFLENHGIEYHFESPDPAPDIHLQGEQRRNIYLVIKESLHNIIKHAGATEVDIAFRLNKNLGNYI